jgi:hypothetical protein
MTLIFALFHLGCVLSQTITGYGNNARMLRASDADGLEWTQIAQAAGYDTDSAREQRDKQQSLFARRVSDYDAGGDNSTAWAMSSGSNVVTNYLNVYGFTFPPLNATTLVTSLTVSLYVRNGYTVRLKALTRSPG